MKPFRIPLLQFPDVILYANEIRVKRHVAYAIAKMGDIDAADELVADLVSPKSDDFKTLRALLTGTESSAIELLPIHALESAGVNEIPAALTRMLSTHLHLPICDTIVQINTVGHTGASGYRRLANQALFSGEVTRGKKYLIVDDFVGQGGTLANMIGYVAHHGGYVVGATVLTGKPYSVRLAPDQNMLDSLGNKYGREFEKWWRQTFGFDFACLTRSEARYLENSANAETVRSRLVAAGLESGFDSSQEPTS